jgi:hypothetical protein
VQQFLFGSGGPGSPSRPCRTKPAVPSATALAADRARVLSRGADALRDRGFFILLGHGDVFHLIPIGDVRTHGVGRGGCECDPGPGVVEGFGPAIIHGRLDAC